MSEHKSYGFTKEEELQLQDFNRNVSTKSKALFYGNFFIISAVPICKFFFFILIKQDLNLLHHTL